MINFTDLMQTVHLNNVESQKEWFHRSERFFCLALLPDANVFFVQIMRRNKGAVDILDVKLVPNPFRSNATGLQLLARRDRETPDNDALPNVVANQRFSLSGFYTDNGPTEVWDDPLQAHAKQTLKIRESRTSGVTMPRLAEVLPSQAAISESHSRALLGDIQVHSSTNPRTKSW